MRRHASRGLAVVAAAAVSLGAAPGAAAATAPWCDATARVLLDLSSVTQVPTRVESQQPTPDVSRLCVTAGYYRALVEFESGPVAPVTFTFETAAGACPITVVDRQQPPRVALSVGVDAGTGAVCLGDASGRTVVRGYVGSGQWFDVDVWANYDCFAWIEGGGGLATSTGGESTNDDDVCTSEDDQLV